MHEGVPGDDRRPPRRARRPQQPGEVRDLEAQVGVVRLRPRDHCGGQVEARDVGVEVREKGRQVPRPAPHVGDRTGLRQLGDPLQHPSVERLVDQLVADLLGVRVGHRVVRGAHAGVARRRPRSEHGLPVDRRRGRGVLGGGGRRPQQVHPPRIVLTRLPFQLRDERIGAPGEPLQAGLDRRPIGEGVQPFGARLQLAGGLRTAQQQHGHQGPLVGVEPERVGQQLVVLQRPRPLARPDDPQQPALLEFARGRLQLGIRIIRHRLPTGRLIARRPQGVQGQRVAAGDGRLLLQERPEHTLFDGSKYRTIHRRQSGKPDAWSRPGRTGRVRVRAAAWPPALRCAIGGGRDRRGPAVTGLPTRRGRRPLGERRPRGGTGVRRRPGRTAPRSCR